VDHGDRHGLHAATDDMSHVTSAKHGNICKHFRKTLTADGPTSQEKGKSRARARATARKLTWGIKYSENDRPVQRFEHSSYKFLMSLKVNKENAMGKRRKR